MKSKFLRTWGIGASGLTAAVFLCAGMWNPSVVAQPAASGSVARSGAVRINNSGATTWDEARSLGRMLENVRVTQDGEDFILYCEELVYNRETNQAIAKGKLRIESRDSTIIGNEIRANFNTKMMVVTGNVTMKSHGTDDGIKGSDPKKKTEKRSLREEVKSKASRMACDRIDYNYENRQAVVTGNIRMVQGKNTGTCERIVFDEEQNIAQLISSNAYGVKFTDSEARTIFTREVVVHIDKEHVQTEYPVRIEMPRRPGDNPAPTAPKQTFPTPRPIPDNPFAEELAPIPPVPNTDDATPGTTAPTVDEKTAPAADKS